MQANVTSEYSLHCVRIVRFARDYSDQMKANVTSEYSLHCVQIVRFVWDNSEFIHCMLYTYLQNEIIFVFFII